MPKKFWQFRNQAAGSAELLLYGRISQIGATKIINRMAGTTNTNQNTPISLLLSG